MSYLELAKKIHAELKPAATLGAYSIDPTDGCIVAVLIDSTILGAEIWFALDENFKPDSGDNLAMFFASELPFLRTKSEETLREIFKVKTGFGGGMVRQ